MTVSLFVRLWVEIKKQRYPVPVFHPSASSWGCELKYAIGIQSEWINSQPLREAVSWNRIIKGQVSACPCQPLREAVSWNSSDTCLITILWPSASSWGCELKYMSVYINMPKNMSASSWGCELKYQELFRPLLPFQSASSWGCELKCLFLALSRNCSRQPLREAVSWNIASVFSRSFMDCQPLREAVSWNVYMRTVLY